MSHIKNESLADNPCTGRCANLRDPNDERCRGCGRTRDQINGWATIPEIKRKIIVMECWDEYMPKQKLERLLDKRADITKEIRREN